MFFALIVKQLKILSRNPLELLVLLLMPVVLITILSVALGPIMDGNGEMLDLQIAIVQHDDEEAQLETFLQKLSESMPIDEKLKHNIQQMLPVTLLLNQLTGNEELKQFIKVKRLDADELRGARKSGDYDVIIDVPKNFTDEYLTSAFLSGSKPSLNVYLDEDQPVTSSISKSMLDYFQQQYSLLTQLNNSKNFDAAVTIPKIEVASDIETIANQESITAKVYYTFSMSVMFILYMASTIASLAFLEKDMHIFDRIVLARIHPITYLGSIIVSTILLAMIQMTILFTVSHFMFDTQFDQVGLYVLITLLLAIIVGALAALLSAINYRNNSAGASNVFSAAIISILALVGGSFIPVSQLSSFLSTLGKWTPNGAALEAYLKLQQHATFLDIQKYAFNLSMLGLVLLVLAFVLFPRRGGIS
ncbi:ABC transporter permease [Viridibacillus sp. YIM B01967]|uniref:ABC transporter permease n=1 Tax=Viridibacillus soli TaxID=2798301 RepID=A0ABS1HCA4_9BACL|nr:ABC transporter permease [Viridibacillus soli]MBK3497050.1 ABC transporter permease [Viridibacillus soli]